MGSRNRDPYTGSTYGRQRASVDERYLLADGAFDRETWNADRGECCDVSAVATIAALIGRDVVYTRQVLRKGGLPFVHREGVTFHSCASSLEAWNRNEGQANIARARSNLNRGPCDAIRMR